MKRYGNRRQDICCFGHDSNPIGKFISGKRSRRRRAVLDRNFKKNERRLNKVREYETW